MKNKPVIWFKQFIDSDGIKIVTKVLDTFAVRGKYVESCLPVLSFATRFASSTPLARSDVLALSTSPKEQEELSECIGIFKDVMNQKVCLHQF